MPRYLAIARHDEKNLPTEPPSPELQQRMGELFEEITKAGVMLDVGELAPSTEATVASWSGGEFSCTDGPFAETKEVIGGYNVVQARDKAEALVWTRRFLEVQGEYEGELSVELREIKDA